MGTGTPEEIQHQLSVGVGTLVGSTVMLLTIPYGFGVLLGRRDYDEDNDCAALTPERKPKLTHTSLFGNCVTLLPEIPPTAMIMILSLFSYVLIQIPSLFYMHDADQGVHRLHPWALACLIVTAVSFLAYCYYQVASANAADMARRQQERIRREQWKKSLDRRLGERKQQEIIFKLYDKDNSGYMDAKELAHALSHLGLKVERKDIGELMESIDVGHAHDGDSGRADGKISLNEFCHAVTSWVAAGQNAENLHQMNSARTSRRASPAPQGYGAINMDDSRLDMSGMKDVGGGGEAEEEEEDEHWDLTENELRLQACMFLLLGTFAVSVFSDPMVDVISQVGDRLNVSPFYVSFIVTPLASNSSEVFAGLMFARKKTNESISMTVATMHGAATMNNTLALCIFMAIIYMRGLAWEYTAEVIVVLVVVTAVGLQTMWRRNIFLWQGLMVLSFYPLSILAVYLMKLIGLE